LLDKLRLLRAPIYRDCQGFQTISVSPLRILRDFVRAEKLGVAAMAVMTTRFVSSVELMVHVLGFPGYPFATTAHPISSPDDNALCAMAASAADQTRRLLLA
jgi:hypothetical protein